MKGAILFAIKHSAIGGPWKIDFDRTHRGITRLNDKLLYSEKRRVDNLKTLVHPMRHRINVGFISQIVAFGLLLLSFTLMLDVPVLYGDGEYGDGEAYVSEELSEKLGERLRVDVSQKVIGSEDQWTIWIFLNKQGVDYSDDLVGVEWNTSQGFRIRIWRGWDSLVVSIQAPLLHKRTVEWNSRMDIGEPYKVEGEIKWPEGDLFSVGINIPGDLNKEALRDLRNLGWRVRGPSSFVDLDYRFVKHDGLEVMISMESSAPRSNKVEVWGLMDYPGDFPMGYKPLPLDALEQLSKLLDSLGLEGLTKTVKSGTLIVIDYRARKETMNVTIDNLGPEWVLFHDRDYQYYFRNEELDIKGGFNIWGVGGTDCKELHGIFRSKTLVNPKKAEDSLRRLFTSIGLQEEALDNLLIEQKIGFGHVNMTARGLDPKKVETAKGQGWDVDISGHSSLYELTKEARGVYAWLLVGPNPGGDVFLLGELNITADKLDELIPVLGEILTALNSEVEPYNVIARARVEVKVETIIKPTNIVNYVTPSKIVEDVLTELMEKELIMGLEENDLKSIMGLADWGIKIHYNGTNWGIRTPSVYIWSEKWSITTTSTGRQLPLCSLL